MNNSRVILGVDVDGVINNFTESYNKIYHQHFPNNNFIPSEKIDDWYWYRNLDYNGYDPDQWMKDTKSEAFLISHPYTGAIKSMEKIFKYCKRNKTILKIITTQPNTKAENECINWLKRYLINYDDIIFTKVNKDKWNHADILIDDSPLVLNSKPNNKISIKVNQKWNKNIECDFEIDNLRNIDDYILNESIMKFLYNQY